MRNLTRLGRTYAAAGQPRQARRHWQRALDLSIGLGLPDIEAIRTHLGALESGEPARDSAGDGSGTAPA